MIVMVHYLEIVTLLIVKLLVKFCLPITSLKILRIGKAPKEYQTAFRVQPHK